MNLKSILLIIFILPTPSFALDFAPIFKDKDGCFVLFDLKSQKKIEDFGGARCLERQPACSTFKVPLALMAFDSGVLKDETQSLKWDKTKQFLPAWEKDHDAASWMKNSVVWFSQRLTKQMGEKKVQEYLNNFDYGTKDISGGLTTAWLTSNASEKTVINSTMRISADEQIKFLTKLYGIPSELKVTANASDLTKKITFLEESPGKWLLSGKTGSGSVGSGKNQRLGWFIFKVEKGPEQYIGVVTFTDKKPNGKGFGGPEAKEIAKRILQKLGKW